ncbi:hypothetical protein BOTBODRAFT_56176 [Botryobasidium botryosum FD-172 SS1]|uniref:Serine-threonine/tyrosine-protein kinase catalytic domain-containing protein n=1 Tax=Botryobasidium botryosum (strain FD-172 SS1) TaxID=930990 RepID=A0A067MCW3_BOTB1|nr:hypothetical protein BOTBODRAFT_56176 [Botryobasidium botryosum FD-172 SS1]
MNKVVSGELPRKPCGTEAISRGFDDHLWGVMTDCWRSNPVDRPAMAEIAGRVDDLARSFAYARLYDHIPLSTPRISRKRPLDLVLEAETFEKRQVKRQVLGIEIR